MQATTEQLDAVTLAEKGETMKLNAFAGAGKTSTLVLIAKALAAQGKKGLYLAFNKSIAEEAQKRMPPNITAKTFHSLAYTSSPRWLIDKLKEPQITIQNFVREFSVLPIKVSAQVTNISKDYSGEVVVETSVETQVVTPFKMKSLVDKAIRCFVVSDDKIPTINHAEFAVLEEYEYLDDIDPSAFETLSNKVFEISESLWNDYVSEEGEYGLKNNHDVYLKHWANSDPQINFDFILFDEAQDADGLMLSVLQNQKCQIIYVGDKHQQIYSWRGAVNAIAKIDASEGWLTQSFRFGQALADACTPVLRHLGETRVITGMGDETIVTSEMTNDVDVFLCRTNAGAISKLLELIRNGVKARINLDVSESIKFIEDMEELQANTKDIDLSMPNLPIYKTKHAKLHYRSFEELELYLNEYGGDQETSLYHKIIKTYDVGFITAMLKKSQHEKEGVFITTAHKSKGLEWRSVALHHDFVSRFFKMQSDTYEQREASKITSVNTTKLEEMGFMADDMIPVLKNPDSEEWRLFYVAMTRAKKALYLGDCHKILEDYLRFFPVYEFNK